MIDTPGTNAGDIGTIEVRVYREGAMVHRQLCETTDDAAAIVDAWEEQQGIECVVTDLSHEPQLDDEFVTNDGDDH